MRVVKKTARKGCSRRFSLSLFCGTPDEGPRSGRQATLRGPLAPLAARRSASFGWAAFCPRLCSSSAQPSKGDARTVNTRQLVCLIVRTSLTAQSLKRKTALDVKQERNTMRGCANLLHRHHVRLYRLPYWSTEVVYSCTVRSYDNRYWIYRAVQSTVQLLQYTVYVL